MKYNEYVENKQHGQADFPIQLYCVDSSHSQYIMPLHWHKELEIIKVNEGTLNLFINNMHYPLFAGDVAFVNCKNLHRGIPEDCEYECIVFDLSMLIKKGNEIFPSFINPIITGQLEISPIFHQDNTELYNCIINLFNTLKEKADYYELATMGNLFMLFKNLYSDNKITQIKVSKKLSSKTNTIADLVKWIDRNYTEHITLDLLAENSNLTPNYLCRIFKEYTGKTPIEYINSVRIENICYEIKWGHKNITEAATDNGYNDISYFCKVFKKHKGMSAQQYVSQFK